MSNSMLNLHNNNQESIEERIIDMMNMVLSKCSLMKKSTTIEDLEKKDIKDNKNTKSIIKMWKQSLTMERRLTKSNPDKGKKADTKISTMKKKARLIITWSTIRKSQTIRKRPTIKKKNAPIEVEVEAIKGNIEKIMIKRNHHIMRSQIGNTKEENTMIIERENMGIVHMMKGSKKSIRKKMRRKRKNQMIKIKPLMKPIRRHHEISVAVKEELILEVEAKEDIIRMTLILIAGAGLVVENVKGMMKILKAMNIVQGILKRLMTLKKD